MTQTECLCRGRVYAHLSMAEQWEKGTASSACCYDICVKEVPLYRGSMDEDLRIVGRGKLAETITGGLSITTKMPCPSHGISATRCRLGAILAGKPGTVCSKCYALKGRYAFSNVQKKLEERYQGLFDPL